MEGEVFNLLVGSLIFPRDKTPYGLNSQTEVSFYLFILFIEFKDSLCVCLWGFICHYINSCSLFPLLMTEYAAPKKKKNFFFFLRHKGTKQIIVHASTEMYFAHHYAGANSEPSLELILEYQGQHQTRERHDIP